MKLGLDGITEPEDSFGTLSDTGWSLALGKRDKIKYTFKRKHGDLPKKEIIS